MTDKTTNTATLALFQAIIAKKKSAPETKFSDYELDFIENTAERVGKYGDESFFSEKQSGLIERMHLEHVQGVKRERKSTAAE